MAPRGRSKRKSTEPFSLLSDDLLVVILSKVTESGDRKSFSEVCKKWYNVEGESRKSLSFDAKTHNYRRRPLLCLWSKLALRFPNLTLLKMRELSDSDLETIAETCKKLETIVLFNFDVHLGRNGLAALGHGCPKLSVIILSGNKIGHAGVVWLVKSLASNKLRLLGLNRILVGDPALGVIAASSAISTLVLRECSNITDHGLDLLATGPSSRDKIKFLSIRACRNITDTGLSHLRNMRSLEHLELSYYIHHHRRGITDIGGVTISKFRTLKSLRLLHMAGVGDTTVVALAENCCNLVVLDLDGCQNVTGTGIRALAAHKCLKRLGLLCIKNLLLSDVETVALGCRTLEPECVLVDKSRMEDPTWSSQLMHVNTRRVINFFDSKIHNIHQSKLGSSLSYNVPT